MSQMAQLIDSELIFSLTPYPGVAAESVPYSQIPFEKSKVENHMNIEHSGISKWTTQPYNFLN